MGQQPRAQPELRYRYLVRAFAQEREMRRDRVGREQLDVHESAAGFPHANVIIQRAPELHALPSELLRFSVPPFHAQTLGGANHQTDTLRAAASAELAQLQRPPVFPRGRLEREALGQRVRCRARDLSRSSCLVRAERSFREVVRRSWQAQAGAMLAALDQTHADAVVELAPLGVGQRRVQVLAQQRVDETILEHGARPNDLELRRGLESGQERGHRLPQCRGDQACVEVRPSDGSRT